MDTLRLTWLAAALAVAPVGVVASADSGHWSAEQIGDKLEGAASEPISVGDRKQLLIDRRFIEVSRKMELKMNAPRKLGPVLEPTKPYEKAYLGFNVSVIKHDGTYMMWYRANGDRRKGTPRFCYAESDDGIEWRKPDLGVREYGGNRQNNIVLNRKSGSVFLDPTAPPEERFKLVSNAGDGLHIHTSPDGIHWDISSERVFPFKPDTANQVLYDPGLDRYVAYIRAWEPNPSRPRRLIMRLAMDDVMEPWPYERVEDRYHIWGENNPPVPTRQGPIVFRYDEKDPQPMDHYNPAVVRYPWAEDAYFMFPGAFLHYGEPSNRGPVDIQMAVSRDGVEWRRPSRWPYVSLGSQGSVDSGQAYMATGMARKGQKILQYYGGMDFLHGDAKRRHAGSICAVSQRLDGFVSADAAYTGGEFVTPPLTFSGDQLKLNVDCSALGEVRVGILNAQGEPIKKGWPATVEKCDPIRLNQIETTVKWNGKADLSRLAGQPIRLHFVMRAAKLYAFEFTGE